MRKIWKPTCQKFVISVKETNLFFLKPKRTKLEKILKRKLNFFVDL
jgi:hypothetical protein